ncbi:MAG: hypothetical protein E2O45_03545 [Nitrospina sp.]|nr:MAG: hypothetical protein E2O45_03545 [Nitrospina sp.]
MSIEGRFSHINNVFRRETGEQGSILIIVLILLATMVAISLGAIQVTQMNVELSGAYKKGKQAFYSAEVGLEVGVNDIMQDFSNLAIYTTTANDGGSPGKTISNYRGYDVYYDITNPLDRFLYQTALGNSTIFHYAHTYDIEATSTSLSDNTSEQIRERIRILETPLVQYYIFYGGTGNNADLELLPGSSVMNSWGRIHANGDIYIGSGSTLTLRNYDDGGNFSPHSISAGGEIFSERKDNGAQKTDVFVKIDSSLVTNPTPQREIPAGDITTANEAAEEAAFNNYVLINEQQYQAPNQTQFWRNGFYEGRAEDPQNPRIDGMKIVEGAGGIEIWVSRPTLEDVTLEVMAGTMPNGEPTQGANTIVRETINSGTLCEDREGDRDVDWTDIDLFRLHTWYVSHMASEGITWAGDGLLLYVSRSPTTTIPFPNTGARLQAIRLISIGGTPADLLANTTVATDNPVYIQGDFNSGGGTVRGVALVADAINMLSNNFTTKNCNSGLTVAGVTNINAAFFGGNVPTPAGGGVYSGGLENYPRLHENWSGVNLNILGSFINLWTSFQADGDWVYGGDRYRAPGRQWGWDVRFQNPDFWPPFIPSIFSVERVGFLEG